MKTLIEAVAAADVRSNRRAQVEQYQAAHQQPIYTLRRTNLQALAEVHGASNLSVMLGYRQPSFMSQILGNGWNRVISEKNARDYEAALHLPEGTLDKPLFGSSASLPDLTAKSSAEDLRTASVTLVADTIQSLNSILKAEGLDISTLQFGKLLSIAVVDAADHAGKVRESHVKQMLELLK